MMLGKAHDPRRQQHLEAEGSRIANLEMLGFAAEKRLFSPHLTLARLRNQALPAQRQAFGKLVSETVFKSDKVIQITAINLIKSRLTRSGAVYSRLSSVPIKP